MSLIDFYYCVVYTKHNTIIERFFMNEFGQYIRNLRTKKEKTDKTFSLRQVSLRLNIQASYLSKIERGIEKPSEDLVLKLAKEFDINEDVLLAMAGKVSMRLQQIIMKNPIAFSSLLIELENSPEHAILRVVREVKDGQW